MNKTENKGFGKKEWKNAPSTCIAIVLIHRVIKRNQGKEIYPETNTKFVRFIDFYPLIGGLLFSSTSLSFIHFTEKINRFLRDLRFCRVTTKIVVYCLEDSGNMFLRNVSELLTDYTASRMS